MIVEHKIAKILLAKSDPGTPTDPRQFLAVKVLVTGNLCFFGGQNVIYVLDRIDAVALRRLGGHGLPNVGF